MEKYNLIPSSPPHWRVQDFPKMQKTPVQKVWARYEVSMTQKNHQPGFSLSPRTSPLLQSWPVRAKKRRFWCTTLKIEILQKWSKFCQKSSFLGLLGRKDIKEGGGVGGQGGCPMGWGQGGQIGQNWGPDGGGCKKWQKFKMLIFLVKICCNLMILAKKPNVNRNHGSKMPDNSPCGFYWFQGIYHSTLKADIS